MVMMITMIDEDAVDDDADELGLAAFGASSSKKSSIVAPNSLLNLSFILFYLINSIILPVFLVSSHAMMSL